MSSAAASPTRTPALEVRRARPDDDAARRALLGAVTMDAELSLSVRRTPTVDAMYALHAREWDSWVVDDDTGDIVGMGALLTRDAYHAGQTIPVGYLGDLRIGQSAEGRGLLDRWYGALLDRSRERSGCEYWLTAIIASNARARRALTVQTERSRRRRRPRYTLLREFDIRSLHLVLPRRPVRSRYRVRRANDADVAAIAALLDADARARPLGYPMPEAELRRRLAVWPGLRIDSFHVAMSATGAIVGVVAPWDASPVKETIVAGYAGAMRRVRLLHDLAAMAFGRPRLPAPGHAFRYQYLTHVAVPSNDPDVFRALLSSAYAAARAERYHFLSACAPVDDPLDVAYNGYATIDLRAHLYLVTRPDTPVPEWLTRGSMPGFEMALV